MTQRRAVTASVEELLANRFGRPEPRLLRRSGDVDALLAGYYGKLPKRGKRHAGPVAALSIHCDAGEVVLAQRAKPMSRPLSEEAIAANGAVPDGPHPRIGPLDLPVDAPPAAVAALQPAAPPLRERSRPPEGTADARRPERPKIEPARANKKLEPERESGKPADAASPSVTPMGEPDPIDTNASEDDFLADMQSIFNGTKVYHPGQKKVVERTAVKEYPRAAEPGQEPGQEPHASGGADGNAQAIFDRIAQSMQYAGAYDLGTVELENRFADFDRAEQERRRIAVERKSRAGRKAAADPADATIGPAEFIQDLDAIQKQAADITEAMKPPLAEARSMPVDYSAPLYDTGEHVMPGGNLYVDQLLVGRPPGVLFSYGEIISMADLFETVDEMMAAGVAELQGLKTLIRRSTAYYEGSKSAGVRDVSNKEWQDATNKRYLKLAEDNYDHFAPNLLFKGAGNPASVHGNHRLAWERHHERAIEEARKMALDPANANRSYAPIWPLIINAFGDHFLTDAFAAGHVINKKAVIDLFKAKFYSGRSLSSAGNGFFTKVAGRAWQQGDVATKFKKLETYEEEFLWWNPDIKNAERFAAVLHRVANAEPDKVGNIVVKAIHDVLNENGIDVTNKAGHPMWTLTGDGHLTKKTLAVMRNAVAQSAANITDPSILASNVAVDNFLAKVWAFVPVLTPASELKVEALVTSYVDPASVPLIDAAAKIITEEVDSFIEALIDRKALQRI